MEELALQMAELAYLAFLIYIAGLLNNWNLKLQRS